MRRLWKTIAIVSAILTIPASAAEAKNLARVVVCGVDDCRSINNSHRLRHLVGGTPSSGPGADADRYRGRMVYEDGRRNHVVHVLYAPDSAELRFDGSWMAIADSAQPTWRRASRGLEPFPGRDGKPDDVEAPADDQGAGATATEDKGLDAGLIAGGLLALGGVAWAAARRLRPQG